MATDDAVQVKNEGLGSGAASPHREGGDAQEAMAGDLASQAQHQFAKREGEGAGECAGDHEAQVVAE